MTKAQRLFESLCKLSECELLSILLHNAHARENISSPADSIYCRARQLGLKLLNVLVVRGYFIRWFRCEGEHGRARVNLTVGLDILRIGYEERRRIGYPAEDVARVNYRGVGGMACHDGVRLDILPKARVRQVGRADHHLRMPCIASANVHLGMECVAESKPPIGVGAVAHSLIGRRQFRELLQSARRSYVKVEAVDHTHFPTVLENLL